MTNVNNTSMRIKTAKNLAIGDRVYDLEYGDYGSVTLVKSPEQVMVLFDHACPVGNKRLELLVETYHLLLVDRA